MLTFLKLAGTMLILAAIFVWSFGVRKMANSGFFQHIDTLTVLVILGLLFLLVVMIYGIKKIWIPAIVLFLAGWN